MRIKRIITLFLVAILVLPLVGCDKEIQPGEVDFKAMYYRKHSGDDHSDFPIVTVIDSTRKLKKFHKADKDLKKYGGWSYSDEKYIGTSMKDDIFKKYNNSFFGEKFLLFVLCYEPSGSIWHEVESVLYENGELTVNIVRTSPLIRDAIISYWYIVIELDKPLSKKGISVIFTNKILPENNRGAP